MSTRFNANEDLHQEDLLFEDDDVILHEEDDDEAELEVIPVDRFVDMYVFSADMLADHEMVAESDYDNG